MNRYFYFFFKYSSALKLVIRLLTNKSIKDVNIIGNVLFLNKLNIFSAGYLNMFIGRLHAVRITYGISE